MVGMLPLANSIWLLVIIGVLIIALLVVGTLYLMMEVGRRHNDDQENDYVWREIPCCYRHVHVLHEPYDWENDD